MSEEAYKNLPVNLLVRMGWALNWIELSIDQRELVEALTEFKNGELEDLQRQVMDLENEVEELSAPTQY